MNNFTMIDNTVLNDQSLSITHKMIYIVLASYMDNKTRSCYPSYGTLAEKAGCSRNTAIIEIKTLVEKEYVIKVRKNNDKKHAHACNLYILAKLSPSDPNPIIRDEIARMIFETSTSTMRDFSTHLENQVLYLGIAKIRDTQAYFKTVFIEYLRSGSLIYGQCI